MSEEKDIEDFYEKSDLLESMRYPQEYLPITNVMNRMIERSSLYIEFLAAAFIKETGLKASECELVSWYDPMDNSFHWRFRKAEGI